MADPVVPSLRSAPTLGLWHRLVACWPLKLVGIPGGIALFFAAYFWVLHHPMRPPLVLARGYLDDAIGVQAVSLPLYLSLWLYVSLAPGLLTQRREFVAYVSAALLIAVVGLGIFLAWPTSVAPLPDPAPSWLAWLKRTDAAGNACPSLHAAFAVLTAFWLHRLATGTRRARLWQTLNVLWAGGILYSTIATAQHVWFDAVAGSALGALAGLWIKPRAAPGSG